VSCFDPDSSHAFPASRAFACCARVIHNEPEFADIFLKFLLARSMRTQADLVDQLFNSSEKRLARILLVMAKFGEVR